MTLESRYDAETAESRSTGGLTPPRSPVETVESDDDRRQQISAGSAWIDTDDV